jgi:spore coat assembly protein
MHNYRNSRYFVETVKQARNWKMSNEDLVIFAGACQSYYEAIREAGADFASSPARVLIDFIDPIIIAQKVATTGVNDWITIADVESQLSNGTAGVDGGTVRGKNRLIE